MPQITINDSEEIKLLQEVRVILQDEKTGYIPTNRGAVILALKYVKEHEYQENGADTRECPEGVAEKF